ncbi:type II toxin-antitoxin system RelE/ParE family toxin [Minwuia sp.]|uniref:type II toxin-antitoxin system RelE/ParE family toxin n=1 Tax=Minwuia sp. TaxID=2493630 RepID=UPI003A920BA5
MKERPVVFAIEAQTDLVAIHDYIAERAGTVIALGYVERIEAFCLGLGDGSERGTRRENLGMGVRTIGFERRATVAFTIDVNRVTILRIYYGGRGIDR